MTFDEISLRLREAKIENYLGEARLLLEHFSSLGEIDEAEQEAMLSKRCEGYPLQYIIGKWWFCRCELEVNENCLIPRADTETIVEIARDMLPQGAKFADLCTGSGCIAIGLLDLRPDTFADAYELYPKTLELAQRNAKKNNVSDRFCGIMGDVLDRELLGDKKYSAIISNPPYIRTEVVDTLSEEVKREPRAALDGGEDGLVFYRAIVENYEQNLEDGGFFLFEIGYDQAEDLREIAALNGFSCEIRKDLCGNDRAAILYKK